MAPNNNLLHPALRSLLFGIELFISITLGILIVFPVLFVLLGVNEVLRLIVRTGLWLWYGEKYQLCPDTRSAVPKDDNHRTILYAAEVEGPLDIESITNHYQKHVVENKVFATLQLIWENKWGFMCLKKCDDFNISNHIRVYPGTDGRIVTEKELLQDILPDLRIDMDRKDKPQWEEVIIHQYKPASGDITSMRILRMNHAYMDGTSTLIHFVANTWSGDKENFPYVINPCKPLKISKLVMFFYKLTCISMFSSFLIRRSVNPPVLRKNRFSSDSSRGKALFNWTKPIPINDFRKIKEKSGVSMSGVLAAVLGGAVRNYEKEYPAESEGYKTTERHPLWIVAGIFPFPKDRLCNDHIVIETYLDISDISGCERLTEMNDELSRMAKNPAVTVNYWFAYLFGGGPTAGINFFLSLVRCPIVLSNVPLCTKRIQFGGKDCSGLNGWVPLMAKAGLTITTVRYGEHMRYCMQAHESIMKEEQLTYLVHQIEEQVEELGLETSTLKRKISTDVTLYEREKGEGNNFRNEDEFNSLNNNNNSNGRVSINNYSHLFKLKDSIEQIRHGIKKIKEE